MLSGVDRRLSFQVINTQPARQGMAAVNFIRDYFLAFEDENGGAMNSAELIEAISRRYLDLTRPGCLELGAKVVKGELKLG